MTTPAPAVWSDGDPLMAAIAAAVSEQCATHPEQGLTVDDPRTIAAVAATVARQVLGIPTTDPAPVGCPCAVGVASDQCSPRGCVPASAPAAPADRATDRRDRYADAILDALARDTTHGPHWGAAADAAMAVADAEQAELRAELDATFLHKKNAELHEQLRADRTAVLRKAADALHDSDLHPIDRRIAIEALEAVMPGIDAESDKSLRRVADEAQPETDRDQLSTDPAARLLEAVASVEALPVPDTSPGWALGAAWALAQLRRLANEATAAHHTVDGTRYLCHDGDHYCLTSTSRLADEAQPTETEAAPQCTAGLLPATGAAVDRCIRRGKHDSHETASGALWGDGSADDDDPICGDRYDDEACELDPGHDGAHCAGTLCWDYGRAPATAATEEPQP